MAFSFPFAQVGHPSCRDPRCGLRPLESHGSRWRYPAFLDTGLLNHHSGAQIPIWPSTRGCRAGLRSAWGHTSWSSHSPRFFPNHCVERTGGSLHARRNSRVRFPLPPVAHAGVRRDAQVSPPRDLFVPYASVQQDGLWFPICSGWAPETSLPR